MAFDNQLTELCDKLGIWVVEIKIISIGEVSYHCCEKYTHGRIYGKLVSPGFSSQNKLRLWLVYNTYRFTGINGR